MEAAVGRAIGQAIRFYRGRYGFTQEQLAAKAGIAPTSVVRLENGEIERPRISTLTKIADALEVDPQELTSFVTRNQTERSGSVEASGAVLTAIYELTEDGWWVVSVPEIPGAHSQGRTLEEAREMIKDAVKMLLEVRREDAERELEGKGNVVREPLEV